MGSPQGPQLPLPGSLNGFFHRRVVAKDLGARPENISQSGKSNPGSVPSAVDDNVVGCESASRDRLMYLTTCLVGRHVDVHVSNGSVFAGIFSAIDAEKDFGIMLKKAWLIGEGTQQGELASKALPMTLIIPSEELVQVIAMDVDITLDGLASEVKPREMSTDSSISQSRNADVEKELIPWVPDEDNPQLPGLENTLDVRRDRDWDQFETNSRLFGVKSTYNLDLYTTKLERDHQTSHVENEALRIAHEIEGEKTQDLHVAEERGQLTNDDIDEEDRYSSVSWRRGVDGSGYKKDEDTVLDAHNSETFGASSAASSSNRPTDFPSLDSSERAVMPSSFLTMDEKPSLQSTDSVEKQSLNEDPNSSLSMDSRSSLVDKTGSHSKQRSSAKSTTAVSRASSKGVSKKSSCEVSEGLASSKAPSKQQPFNSRKRPGRSTSSNSEHVRATSASRGPGLSPSSPVGSLSSERPTLNPSAQDFRAPQGQTVARPQSPVPSIYYTPNFPHATHMPGMPVPYGIGPTFPGHPQAMYNPAGVPMQPPQVYYPPHGPQAMYEPAGVPMQPPQVYYPPHGVQYGQQMPPGQHGPGVYMPYPYHHPTSERLLGSIYPKQSQAAAHERSYNSLIPCSEVLFSVSSETDTL